MGQTKFLEKGLPNRLQASRLVRHGTKSVCTKRERTAYGGYGKRGKYGKAGSVRLGNPSKAFIEKIGTMRAGLSSFFEFSANLDQAVNGMSELVWVVYSCFWHLESRNLLFPRIEIKE